MTTTQREFERLTVVFDTLGYEMDAQPPASEAEIESILETTGVNVDDSLKEFWRITNGSGHKHWFAEGDDDFTPYIFLSVKDVLDSWRLFAPYDAALYEQWYDDEEWGERDPRIQRHFLRHSKWIAFAEFNGGSHVLHFDADPTSKGYAGQVINYIHDPDGVFWRPKNFLTFFKESNDTLEEGIKDDRDYVSEQLWLSW